MKETNRLRELRETAGMTQEALAIRVGTDKSQIRRLESGERRLTLDWMKRLAEGLGVEVAELVAESSNGSGFGERLTEAREKAGISQSELARRVGISQQAIQSIEAGNTKASRRVVEIASALGVQPEWLSFGAGKPERKSGTARLVLEIRQEVTPDQAARIFAILNEGKE